MNVDTNCDNDGIIMGIGDTNGIIMDSSVGKTRQWHYMMLVNSV